MYLKVQSSSCRLSSSSRYGNIGAPNIRSVNIKLSCSKRSSANVVPYLDDNSNFKQTGAYQKKNGAYRKIFFEKI